MKILLYLLDKDGAQVVAQYGPYEPSVEAEINLGRDDDNDIVLTERSISRRHARIRHGDDGWKISDLQSRYGVRLNDDAVWLDSRLHAGDLLMLGRVRLQVVDAAAVGEEPSASPPDEAMGEMKRFQLLRRILDVIASDRSLSELLSDMIELAGKAVDADRGVILLMDEGSGRWRPDAMVSWHKTSGKRNEALSGRELGQISSTVLRETLTKGKSVFLKFALSDPLYGEAASIVSQEVQTLICCPLLVGDKRVGAFYLDRKHEGSRPFTKEDTELLESIAGLAARALEKEQLLRERGRSEQLALLGKMVSRITHELKNPLYNIHGTVENILDKLGDEGLPPTDLRQRLERIMNAVNKAEGRMSGLLRFARPSSGEWKRVQLSRVINAAAVEVMPLCEESNAELKLDYRKKVQLRGDADALEQVFGNLFVNAIQAMGEHGGEITVTTELQSRLGVANPDWIEINVADNGPGLPEEDVDRLFEDFFSTKTNQGGSGLGLAICKHIVELHRGEIRAENRSRGGARFIVGLPLPEQKVD